MERFADHDGQIYFRLKLEALKTQKLSLAAGRASGQARAWPPPGTWLPIDPWPPLAALVKIEEIASRRGREWRRWRGRRAGRRGRRWQGRRGQGRRGQGRRRRQGRRWQGQRRQRPRRLGRSSCQHHGGLSLRWRDGLGGGLGGGGLGGSVYSSTPRRPHRPLRDKCSTRTSTLRRLIGITPHR